MKNKKILTIIPIVLSVLITIGAVVATIWLVGSLIGRMTPAVGETESYDFGADFLPSSLEIEVGGAEIRIEQGDKFLVESNLKYLEVTNRVEGVLVREKKHPSSDYEGAFLTIYIPEGVSFGELDITTGAGTLYAKSLSAEVIDFELGAGEVIIDSLVATREASIEGGAGKVTIGGGSLRDLDLAMGVGELDLTTEIVGEGELALGVGQATLRLIGDPDSYTLKMNKGIGDITYNGSSVGVNQIIGIGATEVKIDGGIGSITIFTE